MLGDEDRVAIVVTTERIVAVDRADLPERLPYDEAEVTFIARSNFSRRGREPEVSSKRKPNGLKRAGHAACRTECHRDGYRGAASA
ncbi:hypothetical protein [Mesorhizobium sp.]|uniref:hypothetical protein n=1 Tax=Mesorhizobium sp. TaxID=1871066 RepID=UPI000FE546BF|nr:hypothetical protein [Mesorhizobium sp.]RWP22139.1 MAG: hypothetical protein EOR02_34085 [Mesorhizobium sp.]RWQ18136.1 MAG: hypothetical protein EOS19_32980 [Mesorhizobium sp.]